jgi:hypothetical protein
LEHSTDEALGRIAGATTIVNAVDGLSVNDAVSIANFVRRTSRYATLHFSIAAARLLL